MHLINHEVILASPTIYDACESRTGELHVCYAVG